MNCVENYAITKLCHYKTLPLQNYVITKLCHYKTIPLQNNAISFEGGSKSGLGIQVGV
jgi:hypothetical protein